MGAWRERAYLIVPEECLPRQSNLSGDIDPACASTTPCGCRYAGLSFTTTSSSNRLSPASCYCCCCCRGDVGPSLRRARRLRRCLEGLGGSVKDDDRGDAIAGDEQQ